MQRSERRGHWRLVRLPVVVIFGAGLLAGCVDVPDYANPVEWYHDVADMFDDDDDMVDGNFAPPPVVPGADDPYPTVGSVPAPPPANTTLEELEEVQIGLVADRAQAHYTDDVVRGEPSAQSVQPVQPTVQSVQAELYGTTLAPQPVQAAVLSQSLAPTLTPTLAPTLAPTLTPTYAQPAAQADYFTQFFQSSGPRAVAPSYNAPQVASASGYVGLSAGYGGTPFGSAKVAVIYFRSSSASLSADDRATLSQVAALYKQRGGTVRVVGHASSRTKQLDAAQHELINFRVSNQRAHVVADALTRQGVPAANIVVSAMSDNEPIYYESMPTGEAGNRRAEIFFEN